MTCETLELQRPKPAANERISNRQTSGLSKPFERKSSRAILDELFEMHRPESVDERHLVERLAIARSDLDDARQAFDERLRWQQMHSRELYDRGQLERFQADLKAWRADPQAMRLVFGQTWQSATFLRDLWHSVEIALATNSRITFDQIRDVILARLGDWRVDRLDALASEWMGCFMAIQGNENGFVDRWIRESRAGRALPGPLVADFELARAFLAAVPPAEESRRKLRELASEEVRAWSERVEQLSEIVQFEHALYAEATPAHDLGDQAEVRETRRVRRELVSARNRFEKLERRLLALQKSRARSKQSVAPPAEPMRPCSFTAPADNSQVDPSPNETPQANSAAAPPAADSESPPTDRKPRREDADRLAKSWRKLHSHVSPMRIRGAARSRSYSPRGD